MKEYFKKSQRFVALVLTVLVAFTMMPVNSFAATSNKGVAWDGSDRDTAQATRKITWAGSIKATADGGAVTSTLKATLSGDTFTAKSKALATSAYTVSKKPAGLTVSIAVDKTGRVATVKLSGKASASARKDITNFGITFKDSAFTGKKASSVTGYKKLTNAITFVGVSKLTIPTPTTAIVAGAKKAVTVEGFNMGSTVNVKLYDAAGKVVSTTGATIARASGATSKKIVFNITTKATLKAGTYTVKALIGTSDKKTATFKVVAPAPATYTVTYDKNGATGTVSDATKYKKDATVTVKAHTGFTYEGYTFAGWNTKDDGTGTSYVAGSTFEMGSANVKLYAIWDKNAPEKTPITAVEISKTAPKVGDILTATMTPATATATYSWKVGEEVKGSTATYTVDALDATKTITVTVTGTGEFTGTITSVATSPVEPVIVDVPVTSVTLVPNVIEFATGDDATVARKEISAVVAPTTATNQKVKWTITGTDAAKFALYDAPTAGSVVALGTETAIAKVYVAPLGALTATMVATVTATSVSADTVSGKTEITVKTAQSVAPVSAVLSGTGNKTLTVTLAAAPVAGDVIHVYTAADATTPVQSFTVVAASLAVAQVITLTNTVTDNVYVTSTSGVNTESTKVVSTGYVAPALVNLVSTAISASNKLVLTFDVKPEVALVAADFAVKSAISETALATAAVRTVSAVSISSDGKIYTITIPVLTSGDFVEVKASATNKFTGTGKAKYSNAFAVNAVTTLNATKLSVTLATASTVALTSADIGSFVVSYTQTKPKENGANVVKSITPTLLIHDPDLAGGLTVLLTIPTLAGTEGTISVNTKTCAVDYAAPEVKEISANRSSDTTGTLSFTTEASKQYKYIIDVNGTLTPPTATTFATTGTVGTASNLGAATISATGLAKDTPATVYLMASDNAVFADGNKTDVLVLSIGAIIQAQGTVRTVTTGTEVGTFAISNAATKAYVMISATEPTVPTAGEAMPTTGGLTGSVALPASIPSGDVVGVVGQWVAIYEAKGTTGDDATKIEKFSKVKLASATSLLAPAPAALGANKVVKKGGTIVADTNVGTPATVTASGNYTYFLSKESDITKVTAPTEFLLTWESYTTLGLASTSTIADGTGYSLYIYHKASNTLAQSINTVTVDTTAPAVATAKIDIANGGSNKNLTTVAADSTVPASAAKVKITFSEPVYRKVEGVLKTYAINGTDLANVANSGDISLVSTTGTNGVTEGGFSLAALVGTVGWSTAPYLSQTATTDLTFDFSAILTAGTDYTLTIDQSKVFDAAGNAIGSGKTEYRFKVGSPAIKNTTGGSFEVAANQYTVVSVTPTTENQIQLDKTTVGGPFIKIWDTAKSGGAGVVAYDSTAPNFTAIKDLLEKLGDSDKFQVTSGSISAIKLAGNNDKLGNSNYSVPNLEIAGFVLTIDSGNTLTVTGEFTNSGDAVGDVAGAGTLAISSKASLVEALLNGAPKVSLLKAYYADVIAGAAGPQTWTFAAPCEITGTGVDKIPYAVKALVGDDNTVKISNFDIDITYTGAAIDGVSGGNATGSYMGMEISQKTRADVNATLPAVGKVTLDKVNVSIVVPQSVVTVGIFKTAVANADATKFTTITNSKITSSSSRRSTYAIYSADPALVITNNTLSAKLAYIGLETGRGKTFAALTTTPNVSKNTFVTGGQYNVMFFDDAGGTLNALTPATTADVTSGVAFGTVNGGFSRLSGYTNVASVSNLVTFINTIAGSLDKGTFMMAQPAGSAELYTIEGGAVTKSQYYAGPTETAAVYLWADCTTN